MTMSNSIHSRLIYHSKVSSMRFRKLLSLLSCILLTITLSVQNTSAEEITIDQAVMVKGDDDEPGGEVKVYLGEGSQVGYLNENASRELGW